MQEFFRLLFNAIASFFKSPQPKDEAPGLDPEANPPAKEFRNKRLLKFAAGEIGTVEWREGSNPKVERYHAYASKNNKDALTDDVPWCASFVCYCLEKVGMGSTNSRAARSFLKWGISSMASPWPGDIVVFWRGRKDGWQGHVGFLVKNELNHVYVLGGNQRDSVNITRYSKSRLLDIRRSSLHREITASELKWLTDYSKRLLRGGKVSSGGSQS